MFSTAVFLKYHVDSPIGSRVLALKVSGSWGKECPRCLNVSYKLTWICPHSGQLEFHGGQDFVAWNKVSGLLHLLRGAGPIAVGTNRISNA